MKLNRPRLTADMIWILLSAFVVAVLSSYAAGSATAPELKRWNVPSINIHTLQYFGHELQRIAIEL